MIGYVYMITNTINQKKYIGVSMKCDEKSLKNYFGSGVVIKEAIKKYGKKNFKKEILKRFNSEVDAREYEKQLINDLGAINSPDYYNLVSGGYGGGVKGRVISEDTRKKISQSLKGHKNYIPTEEHKKKLSEKFKGRTSPMKGRTQDDSAKKKIAEETKRRWECGELKSSSGYKQDVIECPHCGKFGGEGLMKRWHFDNCKINKK
jgi:group I intron endonuclease